MLAQRVRKEAAAARLKNGLKPGEMGVVMATHAYWGGQDLAGGVAVATVIFSEGSEHYQGRIWGDQSRLNVMIPKCRTRQLHEFEVRILEKKA